VTNLNSKTNYNVFFIILGFFVFSLGVGFIMNDIDVREGGRKLASQNQKPEDKELADIATKKVIERASLSKNLNYGGDPTALEKFLYGDLKGQYKVFNANDDSVKLVKVGEEGVKVTDFKKFTFTALNVLLYKNKDFLVEEGTRDVASVKNNTVKYTVKSKTKKTIADVLINSDDSEVLESLTIFKLD